MTNNTELQSLTARLESDPEPSDFDVTHVPDEVQDLDITPPAWVLENIEQHHLKPLSSPMSFSYFLLREDGEHIAPAGWLATEVEVFTEGKKITGFAYHLFHMDCSNRDQYCTYIHDRRNWA